jgi:hypothetical protein
MQRRTRQPRQTCSRADADPPDLRGRLVASFNSGFKLQDSGGGFASGVSVTASDDEAGYGIGRPEPLGVSGTTPPARSRGRSCGRTGLDAISRGRRPLSVHQVDFARSESITGVHPEFS